MAIVDLIVGDLHVQGNITCTGSSPEKARSDLVQEDNARYAIPLENWRVWDAMATNLPGTSATDDLAFVGGTFATAPPSIQTSDLKTAGSTTRYARVTFKLPHEYVAGQSVTIRAKAGMKTTVADTAATIDFQAYRSGDDETIGSDLVTTSATTINSLTLANKDFTLSTGTLLPGDTLDIRMAVLVNDAASVTAVIGLVGGVEVLVDVKG